MAQTSTMANFTVELNDVDRGVYETLTLAVAQHPSEAPAGMVTRVLARCLEHAEGAALGRGVGEGDAAALTVTDLTGALRAWVDIGTPDAARLHRAAKAAPRVAVYCHKDPAPFLRSLAGQRVHRAEAIELLEVDRGLVAALVETLDRRNLWQLSRIEGVVYVEVAGRSLSAPLRRLPWPA